MLGKSELIVPEGGSAAYTVALDSEPTADVTVTIAGHARTDLTLTPTTARLTFTPSTWNRTQTVTVAAGDDGDALNDSARLTHRASGATEYASVSADLSVTVTDDDTKATGAPTITGTAEVGEELTANTSGIADADGLNNVSYAYQWVRVASGGVETDIPSATSAGYTVTVGDVGDAFKLTVTFTDDKGNPEALTSHATAAVIVAQVTVSFGAAVYGAAEGGLAADVQIVLDKDPHRTVTIPLTATPGGGAGPADYAAPTQAVFNAGETSKNVTVTAVDDGVDDDGESVELTLGTLPAGVSEGATTRSVVQITDNDGKGIALSPTSLGVTEGGSATYGIALASQPTADVAVTITGHSGTDLGLNRTSLTFTMSNWNIEQSVMASAAQDSDSDTDSATLTHAASGGGYTGVTAALAVTVTDDDARATGAPFISGPPEVGETLTADTSGIIDSDGLTSPRYRYQWVRVASGGVGTDIPRATSATYRVTDDDVGVALKVKATFTDDKGNPESVESALTAVVTVAQVVASFGPGPYAAVEGGSARVRVALDKDPHRTVTITLTATPRGGADSGDYMAPAEVVFNAGETSKDLTVTAADDDEDDDSESVELAFRSLPVGVSEGATTRAVVQITDNDGRGIDLSTTSLAVSEGGSATSYTVALASQPMATVRVTIGGHLGTDVSLDNTLLFFTPSTWNIAQTVMVSAAQDPDENNDSATLTHTASGADYAGVTAAVAVTVLDDDRPSPPPPPPITIGGTSPGGGGGGGGGGAPPPDPSAIVFSPNTFSFEAVEGGDNPPPQTLKVWNAQEREMAFGTSENAPWLSRTPSAGISDGPDDAVSITLSVDVSGLEPGSYAASVRISGRRIGNSPQRVPVTLTVRPPGYARERVSPGERTEIVTPDSTLRLIVPENAASAEVDIEVEKLDPASQPSPPGDQERVALAVELNTFSPGGETPQPITFSPGAELRLLLSEDEEAACAAGRVRVYRVSSGEWKLLDHRCETDEEDRVWAVSVLTSFNTFVLTVDDTAYPTGSICWSVSNILSWTTSKTSGSQPAANTLLVWLEGVLRLWLSLSCR